MLLELTTTHQPATDFGYLLHKHPDKLFSTELSVGNALVFYPEANEEICTACLLLDINPVDLVRGDKSKNAFLSAHYVNDRPYTSNSFLSTAISKAFGSAINGTCPTKPELVVTPIPLKAKIHSLRVDCDPAYIPKLFEPLGYTITIEKFLLDAQFPSWGSGNVINLTVEKTTTLKELLTQLYVFMTVLDNSRHYYISKQDIDTLIRRGDGWLDAHPEKDWITKRFLKFLKPLTNEAFLRLSPEAVESETAEIQPIERTPTLHQQRLTQSLEFVRASGAESVLDVGCGEGKLLKMIMRDGQFKKIGGMDVSFGELQRAKENLHLEEASPAMRERIALFQSSVTYRDERFKEYEALVLVEVIEHLDEERLPDMAKVIFGFAQPKTVIMSTPNAEYNVVYEKLSADTFRHTDHRFEWTRKEFSDWCEGVGALYCYTFKIHHIGKQEENLGAPSQMVVFNRLTT